VSVDCTALICLGLPAPSGVKLPPLLVLNSVNTSKKLSMWKPPVTVVIFVCPVEVSVGLSLSITPAGRLPPLMSSWSISVSNVRVAPVRLLNVTFIDPVTGAWK
jgi:hypothetical protein